jgi:isoquinoline 1-oxidoreductase alpha subunit
MTAISLKVNGKATRVDCDPETPLLWVLRDHLGLTGTKFGCGIAQCGACTVHLNGAAVRSCQVQARDANGTSVTTIEGLSAKGDHILQRLWNEMNVPQCGYCQTDVLMAAADLLKTNPKPSDSDIDSAITNICRCGTYPRIRAAIRRASGQSA